jgi:hypothetical protein
MKLLVRTIIYANILIFKFAERRCERKQFTGNKLNLHDYCDMTAESWNSETRRVGHC